MRRCGMIILLAVVAALAAGCGGGGGEPGPVPAITVLIAAPAAGANIDIGTTVQISAEAEAGAGVARVEFSIDGTLIHTDSVNPYQANWDTNGYSAGPHTVRVTGYDADTPQHSTYKEITVNLTISGFTVYTENVQATQGSPVTVTVRLANAPSTPAGYQMTVGYDSGKLQLANGADSVQPGSAVPANHLIAKNVTTAGVVQVAIVGWNDATKQIQNLSTTNTALLTMQFEPTAAGSAAIDIDPENAPTPLQFWTSQATKITPGPAVSEGTVTITAP